MSQSREKLKKLPISDLKIFPPRAIKSKINTRKDITSNNTSNINTSPFIKFRPSQTENMVNVNYRNSMMLLIPVKNVPLSLVI